MKPDAPAEFRGLWKPIKTKVPGFDITELYPKQAKVTDKFSIVRCCTTTPATTSPGPTGC